MEEHSFVVRPDLLDTSTLLVAVQPSDDLRHDIFTALSSTDGAVEQMYEPRERPGG
ncbi:MAG: hypothetical protein FWF02_07960 [Micrococcales bacterium]|nr:hypothetical protein [Micrococcales bacterium]MCL2667625.1 hypothetical protein [Micrococcales bacterium]